MRSVDRIGDGTGGRTDLHAFSVGNHLFHRLRNEYSASEGTVPLQGAVNKAPVFTWWDEGPQVKAASFQRITRLTVHEHLHIPFNAV
jgi:hypothetical protein